MNYMPQNIVKCLALSGEKRVDFMLYIMIHQECQYYECVAGTMQHEIKVLEGNIVCRKSYNPSKVKEIRK